MASLSVMCRNAPSLLDSHVDAFLSPTEASRAPALCILLYTSDSVCDFPPSPAHYYGSEESTALLTEAADGLTHGVAQDYGEEEATEPRLTTGISEPLGIISLHDIMATSDQAESGSVMPPAGELLFGDEVPHHHGHHYSLA